MTMIECNSIENLQNNLPLRSINDYSNDGEVEAALQESIHCISSSSSTPKYRKPQQPSLVDWCLANSSEDTARQAVTRELRRLKSLTSLQVTDDEAPIETCDHRGHSFTASNGMCLHGLGPSSYAPAASETAAPTTAASGSGSSQKQAADQSSTQATLNRLVDMATRMFDVPTAVISVTDMELQKVLAAKGFGDLKELPRAAALGARLVESPDDAFVVPDLTKDDRFRHLEIQDFRFYATVALITPEGEKIGAFCLLDNNPRPEGVDEIQLQLLHHLAGLAMQGLVERRTRLRLEQKLRSSTRVVSATVHDLLTPLTAIELAVSLLHEDQDFQGKLSQHQKESVKIASNCIGVLGQMCRRMRDQYSASCKNQVNDGNAVSSVPIAAPSRLLQMPNADVGLSADSFRIMYGSGDNHRQDEEAHEGDNVAEGKPIERVESSPSLFESKVLAAPRVTVTIQDLVNCIHMGVDAIPKTIPVSISLHASVPPRIVTDDLKVLRCALNLLEHCASISSSGSILLSIKPQYCSCGKAMLGFHCENRSEDSASCECDDPARVDECIRDCCGTSRETASQTSSECCHHQGASGRQCLRSCSEVNLYSVAMQMDALGGDCGLEGAAPGSNWGCGAHCEGRIFWFRIPLVEPPCPKDDKKEIPSTVSVTGVSTTGKCTGDLDDTSSQRSDVEKAQDEKSQGVAGEAKQAALVLEAQPRKRRALIIEDSIVIRKVIANALSKIGFETETAVNGMEGLHHLQSSIYDVTLCDFLMPVMDGLDCVKQYRDWEKVHRPFLRQYIIGMSAHASDQDVERGLEAGMNCYKPKPLTFKGLKNIVDACERNQQEENLVSRSMDTSERSAATDRKDQMLPSYDRQQRKMCLIAARGDEAFVLTRLTEAKGWNSLIVHDGEDALQALKKRNWDAVFLDEKLPLLNGRKTSEEFRLWEKDNRVNCQTNMFILSASSKTEVSTGGADGVLRWGPVDPRAFENLLEKAEEPSLHIIMR